MLKNLPSKKGWLLLGALALFLLVLWLVLYSPYSVYGKPSHQTSASYENQINSILESAELVEPYSTREEIMVARELTMGIDKSLIYSYRGGDSFPAHYGNPYCLIVASHANPMGLYVKSYISDPLVPCSNSDDINLNVTSISQQLRTFDNPAQIGTYGSNYRTMQTEGRELHEPYIYIGRIKLYPLALIRFTLPELFGHYLDLAKFQPKGFFSLAAFTDLFSGRFAYTELKSRENYSILFGAGEQVHVLINPEGSIYIMTSYTTESFKGLSLHNLNGLGKMLDLPSGWEYRSYILAKPLSLKSTDFSGYSSVRMMDSYGDLYLKVR